MYANFNTNCLYCWHLLLEEYGPMIHNIPGSKTEAADALSQLPYDDMLSQEHYKSSADDLSGSAFPLHYRLLEVKQSTDKALGAN